MHIYIYIHIYIYTCIHMNIDTYIHIHIYTYIHIYIYTYIHLYIYTYVHIYIYIHLNTYLYIYIYTFKYIYKYIHILYIHIYIYTYITSQVSQKVVLSEPRTIRGPLPCPCFLHQFACAIRQHPVGTPLPPNSRQLSSFPKGYHRELQSGKCG